MIAAFLCGLLYGWLSYWTWQQEATRREKHEAFGAFLRQHGSYLKHYREQQNYPKWGDNELRRDMDEWEGLMREGPGAVTDRPYLQELQRIMLKKGVTTGCCDGKDGS